MWWLLVLFMSAPAAAKELKLFEPREAYVDVYKNHNVHDPYLAPYDKDLTYGAKFNLSFNAIEFKDFTFYMENILHFDQDSSGQVRHAGWNYETGLNLPEFFGANIGIFREHWSRHILDRSRVDHFPTYDHIGVRVWIFK